MLDPLDQENMPYFKALSKKRKRAFIALTIENIALHSWRLFFWALMFLGLWMLEIPAFFGGIISVVTSLIFIAGIIYLIKKDILSFRFPKEDEIIRILENQSNLPRGQITILSDELANPNKHNTRALWEYAQKEMLRSLKSLKPPRLRHVLSRKDPAALRLIAMLVFVAGLLVSGNNWLDKIYGGIVPITPAQIISQGRDTNIWIKPPEYTQIGQIHIIGGKSNEALNIPEGSKIRVRLHSMLGEIFAPVFYNGDNRLDMTYMGSGLYGIETTIKSGDNIKVKQGLITRASWDYNFITDTPPEIREVYAQNKELPPRHCEHSEAIHPDLDCRGAKAPRNDKNSYEIMDKGQIRFSLIVKDDYGVKNLHMSMKIDEMVEDRPLGKAVQETRLVMSRPDEEFKISPVYDLSWHTWAGLPVTFEYSAIDHKGQKTTLDKILLTLPEREFKHPMAKSLIAMRKRLAWDYDASFIDISRNLEILLSAPDYFQNNITIYLAIRSAASRLFYSDVYEGQKRIETAQAVIKILWDTAITIEDGDLSLAMRELRAAQRALENALSDPNSTDREIAAIMDNLREKMANYFAEMQREMQKNMANGDALPPMSAEDFGQIISPDALSTLMQQIESALKSGDTQKAQELMSQLQRMMEMIDPSMSSQLPMDVQAMREGVNELQKLIESQEMLLEQSITSTPPAKEEQEALRYILGQLMLEVSEKLDEIPEAMGMAEQEMRLSENALGDDKPFESIPHQELAIKHLKDSQEALSKQFKQRMQQMVGVGFNTGIKRDPLGRPLDNRSNDVKLPDRAQKKRVDEILKTLRDRSGDLNRPDEELDYFRRLLRQF